MRGKNARPLPSELMISAEKREKNYNEALRHVKSLKLQSSEETQYNRDHRIYVPRDRIIGYDGVVRANRLRNAEPNKRPEDSTYMKLFNAFAELRRNGVDAKWNISVPDDDTRTGYWCSLPDDDKPRVTHWKALGITNSTLQTGIQWTKDWDVLQNVVSFESVNGATDQFIETMLKFGFNAFLSNEYRSKWGDHDEIQLCFHGSPANIDEIEDYGCRAIWTWYDYAASDNKVEPPKIGSIVDTETARAIVAM